MIDDARGIPTGTRIYADVCIAGGGAAGITLARELANTGMRIVLIVGGGRRERAEDRDLHRGSIGAGTSHEPLEENRRRCWGGATTVWGGRCIPLDAMDFEYRAHVPHSGWPINYSEMFPFYERANEICEAGDFLYDMPTALPGRQREMIRGFDGTDVVTTRLERWSPPTDFGRRYGRELQNAREVRVLMHAHAINIRIDPTTRERVTQLDVATKPGASFGVLAQNYVLACGGLENPRLLLASKDVEPRGIGNRHGNVGRFYMSHFVGAIAAVELRDARDGFVYDFERDAAGVYCRRRMWITPEAQRRVEMGNAIAFFHRPGIEDVGHRNGLFSATYLAKAYSSTFRRQGVRQALETLRVDREARGEHWSIVRRDLHHVLPQAARLVQQRWLSKRRLPIILGEPSGNRFELRYSTEHIPNPDSRVQLQPGRDAFGMPRLTAHVAFSRLDFDTIAKFHDLVAHRLEESGVGRLKYDQQDVRAQIVSQVGHFNSNAHHLGTTRMATSPDDGVVDRDSRVHGLANLYVTGGSVFPTSGHANPTLTIVALAVRLADHFRRRGQSDSDISGMRYASRTTVARS